jgi:hypothetical protein
MASKFGIFEGLPYEEYARIDAVNYSSLKHMMRSPKHYRWHKDHPMPPTEPMKLGAATHTVMLEPERAGDFAVYDGIRRGKEWDAFCADHGDKQILTVAQMKGLVSMSVAIRQSPLAMKYLGAPGASEVTIVWRDKASHIDCKGRVDKLATIDGRRIIVDLKSCRDARPFKFGNEAYRLGYHIQDALYRGGLYYLTGELLDVVKIAIENVPPYDVVVYEVPDEVLQKGHDDYAFLVKTLQECDRLNEWPGAYEQMQQLSLPTYAYGEEVDDLSDLQLIAE